MTLLSVGTLADRIRTVSGYALSSDLSVWQTTKSIATARINQQGVGYSPGDILTLTTGTGTSATFVVNAVEMGGKVTDISITNGGAYTTIPNTVGSVTIAAPPGGNGCTLDLTIIDYDFLGNKVLRSIAYNGVATYCGIASNGTSVTTSDFITWNIEQLMNGWFEPISLASGLNGFVICGQFKDYLITPPNPVPYPEYGAILQSATGMAFSPVYVDPNPGTVYYSVRFILGFLWITLGFDGTNNNAYISFDGLTWGGLFSQNFKSRPLLCMEFDYYYSVLYFGGNGIIVSTPDLFNFTTVDLFDLFGKKITVNSMATNNVGTLVAATSKGVVYSNDGTSWSLIEFNGYQMKNVVFDLANQKWFLSGTTELQKYTYWTSSDGINWTGQKTNNLHSYASINI